MEKFLDEIELTNKGDWNDCVEIENEICDVDRGEQKLQLFFQLVPFLNSCCYSICGNRIVLILMNIHIFLFVVQLYSDLFDD